MKVELHKWDEEAEAWVPDPDGDYERERAAAEGDGRVYLLLGTYDGDTFNATLRGAGYLDGDTEATSE